MLGKILKFELLSRLKRPIMLLFIGMTVFQGIWYTKGAYDYYVNDATLMNASAIFYKNLAGGGLLLIIVVAIVTGSALYKDIANKTAHTMYTLPINEKQFFMGRLLSAYLVNLIVGLGYLLGMVLVPYAGLGPANLFGPTPWGQLFHGFMVLCVPNLLFLTCLSFSLLVVFRQMAAAYLGIFGTVVVFLVMETTSQTATDLRVMKLLDPFGYIATAANLDALPADGKNTAYLAFDPYLLANRLIWLGVTIGLFLVGYAKFTFKRFIMALNPKAKSKPVPFDPVAPKASGLAIPTPALVFSTAEFAKKLWALARMEFANVARPQGFKIILGILVLMFLLQNLLWNASVYIGPTQPITSAMVNTRLTMGVFVMILLMIWSGELFFKDKTNNIWQITDALPVPVWVAQLSKFLAMVGVAFVMAAAIVACGLVSQLLMGGWQEIDPVLYIDAVLGYKWGWLNYVLYIALVFFLAGLTGHRFLTHALGVGYFIFIILSFDLGIMEELRFGYGLTPGFEDYSELNRFGIWATAGFWYFAMWAVLAAALVLFGIYFWQRGTALKFTKKLAMRHPQLSWQGKGVAVLCLAAFFFLQSFIVRQVNDKGNYEPEAVEQAEQAAYERAYKRLENIPQPKISHLDLALSLFPNGRRAEFDAEMVLANATPRAMDTVYLSLPEHVAVSTLQWKGRAIGPAWKDDERRVWALPAPLDSGATGVMRIQGDKAYEGFTQSGEEPQPDLAFNGLWMGLKEILPTIGYDSERELLKNRERARFGLPKLAARMPGIDDGHALRQHATAPDAGWVTGRVSISTAPGQVAVGPGLLHKTWQAGGRNHFAYRVASPSAMPWYVGSAKYTQKSQNNHGAKLTLLHKPGHAYNTGLMGRAVALGIGFIESQLGIYPYGELRLVEVPFYQDEHYAFANTIAVSEKEGWVADAGGEAEQAYIVLSIAAQTIRHWVLQSMRVANVQGAHMLLDALPEALAMQIVSDEISADAAQALLDKKQDAYEKGRGNEPNQEPALRYADGIDYLAANKGVVALCQMADAMGRETFNKAIGSWAERHTGQPVVFADLYTSLLAKVPDSHKAKIKALFE